MRCPSGVDRLSPMLRLLRLSSSNGGLDPSPPNAESGPREGSPSGGSILMTSAPQSPSTADAAGPATQRPPSPTRLPSVGPGMRRRIGLGAGSGDLESHRSTAGHTTARGSDRE